MSRQRSLLCSTRAGNATPAPLLTKLVPPVRCIYLPGGLCLSRVAPIALLEVVPVLEA